MPTWRTVGSVVAGTLVTVVAVALTIVLLPIVGIGVANLVGTWLPTWMFLLPVAFAAVLGGATTGAFSGRTPSRSAALGCLATAAGLAAIGVVVGLVSLVLLLGMTPAHGQEPNLAETTWTMVAMGGGTGLLSGAVFGAIGGTGGHVVRQKFSF
jgi:hypothetical protein